MGMSDTAELLIDHRRCAVAAAGLDLADANRLDGAVARSNGSLLNRLFDADERAACMADAGSAADADPMSVARLFGIKESVVKAIGGMPRGGRYRDMHIGVDSGAAGCGLTAPVAVRLGNELGRWADAHQVEVIAGGAPVADGLVLAWALAVPRGASGASANDKERPC
jgi:phosphopantetheinyl transferase (holo-ACP synthase)